VLIVTVLIFFGNIDLLFYFFLYYFFENVESQNIITIVETQKIIIVLKVVLY